MDQTQKITVGVDWGSSSFRAYRFDSRGEAVEFVESPDGIKTVESADFESVLLSHVGDWLQPGDTVLLAGMITSRNGWAETPYLHCPLDLSRLLEKSVSTRLGDAYTLLFLPGACVESPADVMRGEELQLHGAVRSDKQLVVLPGTHSKWALVNSGVLERFHTIATGELFDVLMNQTLIGGLGSSQEHASGAFARGVVAGYASKAIVSALFTARSGVLLNQLAPAEVYSYLSGLLIGNEVKEAMQTFAIDSSISDSSILIVGSGALCSRYAEAFGVLDIDVTVESQDAAVLGFQKLIKQQK